MTTEAIKNLSENERRAMSAICADCDEIDDWGFDRPSDAYAAAFGEFNSDKVTSDTLNSLMEKDVIEIDLIDDTLWVKPEVYASFC